MSYMFYDCKSLIELDVSNFNTSNVKNMTYMFAYCYDLTSLDVSNFNTSNVISMSNMFYNCKSLTTLDVSNFNTSKATNVNNMFYACEKLTKIIGLNNWDISKITNMTSTFNGCKTLIELDVSNWDISKITASYYLGNTFDNCTSLVDFYPPKNISTNMSVEKSTALSHDSLMRIINNLITVASTKTLTLGATNLAKLTDEEKAIATGKGWTVK